MESCYLLLIVLILFIVYGKRTEILAARKVWKRKERKDDNMLQLAKMMVGKECIVYLVMNTQVIGTIQEIGENGILLEDLGHNLQILNLEYITRIREYPRNKKGKKKSIVVD